ncbi:hypothetical protein DL95DRAFT_380396 [Leptodontidium sp. 2 PMI_412]|nr:hypothetical protein DL95DRAFT_380396 [Leptodontidium sp. 2 PMI_412]
MCDDGVAEFACTDRHEARGEDRARLKEIKRCLAGEHAGVSCSPNQRGRAHDWQDDGPDQDCPECRGETPPETP